MSGNTTQLGMAIPSDNIAPIITLSAVICCFLIGIYSGTCLSLWKKLELQTLPFFIVSAYYFYTVASYFNEINTVLSIAIVVFSMGIMNTIVTSVGSQKINTDFESKEKQPESTVFIMKQRVNVTVPYLLLKCMNMPGPCLAAEAAVQQGKFWEMHDAIFENQRHLSERLLIDLARKLNLDFNRFSNDMEQATLADRIDADFKSGVVSGVNGALSFLYNGNKFDGGVEGLLRLLEENAK